jgi:ribosome biogenesis GTPase A
VRYGFPVEGLDGAGLLEAIAKKRGCLRKGKGGEPDREMAARILLADYREGKLGRTSLETPETREAMVTR